MAIDDKILHSFFQKQKKASTDALRPIAIQNANRNRQIEIVTNNGNTSSNKTVSKRLANREQTVSKRLAKREQTVSKLTQENQIKVKTVSKPLAEALAEALADREQTVSKRLANLSIESLVGNEKKLMLYLFNKCQNQGALETNIITSEELREILKISANHLRNLIFRLTNKNFLEISEIKNGRAGWRKFKLPKNVFQNLSLEASVSKALADREQIVSKPLAKPLAEALAASSSSSSNNLENKITTTGGTSTDVNFLEVWQTIIIDPLRDIGFTQTHLRQIAQQGKLTPDMVQTSIHAFAFDLVRNKKSERLKAKNIPPLNYFMGVLRNGQPYAPPANSEQDSIVRYCK